MNRLGDSVYRQTTTVSPRDDVRDAALAALPKYRHFRRRSYNDSTLKRLFQNLSSIENKQNIKQGAETKLLLVYCKRRDDVMTTHRETVADRPDISARRMLINISPEQ